MGRTRSKICVLFIALLLTAVQTKHNIEAYEGALVGDIVHVGTIKNLLKSSRTYSKDECQVKFNDEKEAGDAQLVIDDKDSNEQGSQAGTRPLHLVAKLNTASGRLAYTLKCGEEYGVGIIQVHSKGEMIVTPDSALQLDLNVEQAAKTRYAFLKGIHGNNIGAEIKSEDKTGYFEAVLGGLKDLKFYEKGDDGTLTEVRSTTFSKILPLREFNYGSDAAQKDRDLLSTLAVIQSDGVTVSYYDLEHNEKLGRVFVHSGNKALKVGREYTIGICFPALKDGRLTNYYCTYEGAPKKPLTLAYIDLTTDEEVLAPREFKEVSSILSATSLSDGRTCLLALGTDGKKKVLCFDAKRGLDKTPENEATYFSGNTVKIKYNEEECTLNFDSLDPHDFRFGSASTFDCKSGKVVASFDLANTFDASEPEYSTAKTVKPIAGDVTILCVDHDEIAYLKDKNTTLVLEGGFNRPGQILVHSLGIDFGAVTQVHCTQYSMLATLTSKKGTNLLDIKKGGRSNTITRIRRLVNLPLKQTQMNLATAHTAILYNLNKKGQIDSLARYDSFIGLVKISNKDHVEEGNHKMILNVVSGEGQSRELTIQTTVLPSNQFSVVYSKEMKDLKPDSEYLLRDFFNISGQVTKIDVLYPDPKPNNVFWLPDEVRFYNSSNGTEESARFVVDGCFVDVSGKKFASKTGEEKSLEGDLLKAAKHLGNVDLEVPVAFIGAKDGKDFFVQAIFIDKSGKAQSSTAVKLFNPVGESFVKQPKFVKVDGKAGIAFYRDTVDKIAKGVVIQYKFTVESGVFEFVSLDDQKEIDWDEEGYLNGYKFSEIEPKDHTSLSSCVHFKVVDPFTKITNEYQVCGITGGSSRKIQILNLFTSVDGSSNFELINYPSQDAGVDSVSWWKVKSNLFGTDGAPVNPSDFKTESVLQKRFSGLDDYTIKQAFNLGLRAVVLAEKETDSEQTLYEIYYGGRGSQPYYTRKVNDPHTALKFYSLDFAETAGKLKRFYINQAKSFSNVADLEFRDARLKLSKHAATVQVKRPFTLKFNEAATTKDVIVDLDKYYEDDGKTDEDDENRNPEDDPNVPIKGKKRTRLWLILGIIGLILCVGAADLYWRRRSAIAEAESELDHEKPTITKEKKAGDLFASLNEHHDA